MNYYQQQAQDPRRAASRCYREGRKWTRRAIEWSQVAEDSLKALDHCDPEDVEFYRKAAITWEDLATKAAKWAEESREQARRYRGIQRQYEVLAS